MNIKTKLTQQDFINGNFVLLYSKTSTKIITGIGIFMLLLSVTLMILTPENFSVTQIIGPLVVIGALPLFIYLNAKKNYATNQRISESMEYTFDKDFLNIKGESFTTQLTWAKLYKVAQTKNWVFIWHNRQSANCIPKRDIWDEQIEELKVLLDGHKVKNQLG